MYHWSFCCCCLFFSTFVMSASQQWVGEEISQKEDNQNTPSPKLTSLNQNPDNDVVVSSIIRRQIFDHDSNELNLQIRKDLQPFPHTHAHAALFVSHTECCWWCCFQMSCWYLVLAHVYPTCRLLGQGSGNRYVPGQNVNNRETSYDTHE